ncbi:PAS domain-containing protein [Paraburkholderia xenovorans]|uniref:PAS domain-containing protein n=1 Tax=Paraburkholderia xenovorans TaxID=36873 RepID=UPI0038B6F1C7
MSDAKLAQGPLAIGEPGIRFFAGIALRLPCGKPIGMLCPMHAMPRRFPREQRRMLVDLGQMIEHEVRQRQSDNPGRLQVIRTIDRLQVLDPDYAAAIEPYVQRVLSGEKVEYEVKAKLNGNERFLRGVLVPRRIHDQSADGYYLLVQDVTERRALLDRIRHQAFDQAASLSGEALLRAADAAMYRAKVAGKARIVVHELDGSPASIHV